MNFVLTSHRIFELDKLPVRMRYTESSGELGFHSHEFTEIAILFHGSATYHTEFNSERIVAGDVLIIPAGAPHCYTDETDVKLMNILFQFDKLPVPCMEIYRHPGYAALFVIRPDYYRERRFYPKFVVAPETCRKLEEILMNAWDEQSGKRFGYNLTAFGAFCQAIPLLLGGYREHNEKNQGGIAGQLTGCLDYISHNYREILTLENLARRACMSESTFLRHFRLATGTSPIRYIQDLRLRHAAEELVSGNKPVTEIAIDAGFSDGNYFARLFKQRFNQSPISYRDSVKNNVIR